MKKSSLIWSLAVFLCLVGLSTQAEDVGNSLLSSRCTACHGKEKFCAKAGTLNQEDWQSIVTRMKSNGAKISKNEISTISAYLSSAKGVTLSLCK